MLSDCASIDIGRKPCLGVLHTLIPPEKIIQINDSLGDLTDTATTKASLLNTWTMLVASFSKLDCVDVYVSSQRFRFVSFISEQCTIGSE